MNEALRDQHFERIKDEKARCMYDMLCAACEQRKEGLTDPDQMLVADAAMAEQIKQRLMDDIAARGIGQERTNGRQRYWQENRSVAQLRSYADQQRKQLAELRLTPQSRKAEAIALKDDFDDFE